MVQLEITIILCKIYHKERKQFVYMVIATNYFIKLQNTIFCFTLPFTIKNKLLVNNKLLFISIYVIDFIWLQYISG